jgi:hypothetical protein
MAACTARGKTLMTEDERLHAAVVYGESSAHNVYEEMGGIAFAIANRCRAWGKTITQIKRLDPKYAFAWDGTNQRFNQFMLTSDECVMKHTGMRMAVEWMRKARAHEGRGYSNGAMFWDGPDFATTQSNWKRLVRFRYGHPSHNIFGVPHNPKEKIEYWSIRDPKTGDRTASSKERGRYDATYISTVAHGETIFWKVSEDWAHATGGKVYQ